MLQTMVLMLNALLVKQLLVLQALVAQVVVPGMVKPMVVEVLAVVQARMGNMVHPLMHLCSRHKHATQFDMHKSATESLQKSLPKE